MLNPDIVTGVAMLLLFTFVGYSMGFSSLLLSHIAFNIPYVVMSVLPKLKQMNPNLLDAAMDLGMKPATAITKVVVPPPTPTKSGASATVSRACVMAGCAVKG